MSGVRSDSFRDDILVAQRAAGGGQVGKQSRGHTGRQGAADGGFFAVVGADQRQPQPPGDQPGQQGVFSQSISRGHQALGLELGGLLADCFEPRAQARRHPLQQGPGEMGGGEVLRRDAGETSAGERIAAGSREGGGAFQTQGPGGYRGGQFIEPVEERAGWFLSGEIAEHLAEKLFEQGVRPAARQPDVRQQIARHGKRPEFDRGSELPVRGEDGHLGPGADIHQHVVRPIANAADKTGLVIAQGRCDGNGTRQVELADPPVREWSHRLIGLADGREPGGIDPQRGERGGVPGASGRGEHATAARGGGFADEAAPGEVGGEQVHDEAGPAPFGKPSLLPQPEENGCQKPGLQPAAAPFDGVLSDEVPGPLDPGFLRSGNEFVSPSILPVDERSQWLELGVDQDGAMLLARDANCGDLPSA
jgi:hypothetical protein